MTSVVDSPLPPDLAEFVGRVSTLLTATPLGVAFSGGVDSSVLLALAVRTLGPDQVVAILGVSPSLGTDDRQTAHKVAAYIGARLVEVQTGKRKRRLTASTDRIVASIARRSYSVASRKMWLPPMVWLRWPTARTLTMRDGRIDRVLARRPTTRCCGHSRKPD